jgi:shikimate kinase
MKNVYIVGFMGSGKSSVGRILAGSLGLEFIEMDDVIEERESQKIADIFANKGEEYFREVENKLLKELSHRENLIISCGGGLACNDNNLKILKDTGVVFTLKASARCIYERVKNKKHRPLLNVDNPLEEIERLLNKRERYYSKAHYIIDTEDLSIEKIVRLITEKLKNG